MSTNNTLYSLPSQSVLLSEWFFPLCPHFSLDELTTSSFSARSQSNVEYLFTNSCLFPKLHRLAIFLEFLRKSCGDTPLTINSALRSPSTNAAVGGASKSDHLTGDAVDIRLSNLSDSVCKRLLSVVNTLHSLGMIRYFKTTSTYLHISLYA